MKKRYVLYSDDAGIYLGGCMGFGFWSKWDPVGQDHAITFADQEDVDTWKGTLDDPSKLPAFRLVEVWPSNGTYASIEDCANAQLPRWKP